MLRMVSMLRRPWALSMTRSGSMLCSSAHLRHTRSTARVESTRTPSRSKRMAWLVRTTVQDISPKAGELNGCNSSSTASLLSSAKIVILSPLNCYLRVHGGNSDVVLATELARTNHRLDQGQLRPGPASQTYPSPLRYMGLARWTGSKLTLVQAMI